MKDLDNIDARAEIVAMMRANLDRIVGNETGYLQRECEDMLAAGIDHIALARALTQLSLFHCSQAFGARGALDQLRNVVDAFENNIDRTQQVRH
ncbi:MAG: hypothetical protein JWP57_3982 [Spirosoma sp.]|nr:hypothetical protein [Spirosoma sp.]